MNLQTALILSLVTIAAAYYTCSDSDCYECIGNTCHLTCQGLHNLRNCNTCPNGDCCNGDNCNACISSICCKTTRCNECVNENREICNEETFPENCNKMIGEKCGLQFDNQNFRNYYNRRLHNVTTIIKIRNLINNTHVINTPIRLNLTNAYDSVINNTGTSYIKKRKKCCSIIHPQECHNIVNIPRPICFTRRHVECSDLCSNSTNYLITTNSKQSKCIVIAAHPYYYCGYYALEDCSACYHCNGTRKIDCLEETSCSSTCRSSVLPKKFYNVPYYIKTSEETTPANTPANTPAIAAF